MIGLKYKRMLEEILETDTLPGGMRTMFEDVLRQFDKNENYCPTTGLIPVINKSHDINVKGQDIRDVVKKYQLPNSYEGMSVRHSNDGYFIFLEDQKVGRSVAREEGRKILAWLNHAYSKIKEVVAGVRVDGPPPEWVKGEELEEPPYFAADEEPKKKCPF